MQEFELANGLTNLGMKHYKIIHKKFNKLGLLRVRRRRDKAFAEDVWIKAEQFQNPEELEKKLKALRA